jgi:hypothetical protein
MSSVIVLGPARAYGPVPSQTPSIVYSKNSIDHPTRRALTAGLTFEGFIALLYQRAIAPFNTRKEWKK